MKISDRLIERLKAEELIHDPASFERLYPGHWQRSSGAWSWRIVYGEARLEVGSQYTASECVHAKHLECSDGDLTPQTKNRNDNH